MVPVTQERQNRRRTLFTAGDPYVGQRIRRQFSHGLIHGLLGAGTIIMLLPLLWTISTSLKIPSQITIVEMRWIPDPIAWHNYVEIFRRVPVLKYLGNTGVLVVASLFGGIFTCSLVAYPFARIDFRGRELLFSILLSTLMMPWIVTLIPQFIMFDTVGWVGTFLPLALPRLLGHNPFYIFLLRQFFRGIPRDLSDAARMDGCSEFGIFWRVVLPLSKPALAAVAIFSFQAAWNDFLHPLIYLGGTKERWTLALALSRFQSFEGQADQLHLLMVLSVLMIIPMLVVFAVGQRHFVRGVVLSGLKG